MIKTDNAIRTARMLIGTPYSEVDCIGLIKKVIRNSPGGVPGYTTAGTNTLWDSYNASAKYRDLTWRREGIAGARAGMLAFKRSGEDVHHVGLVTHEGTVIHSSSTQGGRGVVETALDDSWHLLAQHRYIEVAAATETEEQMEQALYTAIVVTKEDPLRVRESPATGEIIGSVPKGRAVDVLEWGENGWAKIRYGELTGYASVLYLARVEDEEAPNATETLDSSENIITVSGDIAIIDSEGNRFYPVGSWRVLIGSVD